MVTNSDYDVGYAIDDPEGRMGALEGRPYSEKNERVNEVIFA